MVTGVDHLLFIAAIVFFLTRLRQVALYVTAFSLGHSATLLAGVLLRTRIDPYLVDALIGLSVVWKAFDNLGGLQRLFGARPDDRGAVFGFGLIHGLGLATKLQSLLPATAEALLPNLVAFNVGVELGQILVLVLIVSLLARWRRARSFARQAAFANVVLMVAGVVLLQMQLAGYFLQGRS